jgi:hypothetical protein
MPEGSGFTPPIDNKTLRGQAIIINIFSHLSFGVELQHSMPGAASMTQSIASGEAYISVDVETAGPNPSQY